MSALVLTRKPGQEIIIDRRIRVLVCESSHGRVKLRIEAPPEASIVRGELEAKDERPDD